MINFLKNIYIELRNSQYLKNLFILTGGVGFSQLIPLLLLPVLTRFFTPVDFGVFALFMAIVQLLSIVMTFRLEMAVVLPKKDVDAALLCLMSFLLVSGFSFITLLMVIICYNMDFFFPVMSMLTTIPESIMLAVLCLIPVGVFFLGCYNILYSWNNRLECYKKMTYSHLIHSFISTPGAILFYFSSLSSVGLILGQIIGRFMACFVLLTSLLKHIPLSFSLSHLERCKFLLKEYRRFIVFETPHTILNFISQKMIIAFFTILFGFFTVGVFELADKIIGKPLGIISNSFKTVFYKRLTTAKDKLLLFKKSILLMTFISFFLTAPFYVIPDQFFIFLLGSEWSDTGKYIQLICPLLFSRFIFNVTVPSISYTLQNHYLLVWQTIYLISLLILFWFLHDLSVENVLLLYAIFGAMMYAVLGFVSFVALKNHIKN
mgnify:CR=1 FL=1